MTTDDRYRLMEAARIGAGVTVQQLWLRYVALTGTSDAFDVDGYLQGLVELDPFQQDVLAQASNEALEDHHRSLRVPLTAPTGGREADGSLRTVIQRMLSSGSNASETHAAPASVVEPADDGVPPGRSSGSQSA
jgi:hypothetical protein